jgi:MFS family permease
VTKNLTMPPEGPIPLAEVSDLPARKPQSIRLLILLLGFSFLGLTMAFATPFSLSLIIKLRTIAPATITEDLSLMVSAALLVQVVTLVLVGRLSDSTPSRMGMRRPWLLAGLIALTLGSFGLYYANTLTMLWIGFITLGLGIAVCMAALYALMSDHIPPEHQGLATGVIGATQIGGGLFGLLVVKLAPENNLTIFGVPAVAAVIPIAILAIIVDDHRLQHRIPITLRSLLGSFTINPRTSPSLAWYLPAVFLVGAVQIAVSTYKYFLVANKVGDELETVASAVFYATFMTGVIGFLTSMIIGAVSDRLGRRKPFFFAAVVIYIIGAVGIAFSPSLAMLYVAFCVIGLGNGFVFGSFMAIALETMIDEETTARDINVVVSVQALTAVVIPFIAPTLLGPSVDNYPRLILVSAAATASSLAFLIKVKAR